ncbi:hypothetical protein AYL99_08868 [Fonsecaea erecta]|uniref:Uncharacterized protein n=1 Tax=Fonsecaea erecta TaxID=1367422 RepID=A0A178ZBB3_9EURO|nr:hypothetical protein AYL99_08868 [Fonsecaea erecta]OAP56756.1 hypothetical protein AYL99_08868 [Fonsecaea erecta]
MSLPCPYRHVSYATWRLDVIRTVCQSFDEPRSRPSVLLRENQRPYFRNASTSRSATKKSHDGSAPVPPSVTGSDKKDTRPDGPFSPYSESGRRAIKDLLSDLKKASKKIRLGDDNGESYRFGSHKSLALDTSGGATTQQESPSQSLPPDLPLRKYHSTQGESLDASSVEGQQAIQDLLTELQGGGGDRHRRGGKAASSRRPERETPPALQSPIIARVARARRQREERKEHPSYRRIKGLKNNPWAEILASPLRACQGSGARQPSDLLLDFGYVKNQRDGKIYLMPADLADVDALEAELTAELATLECRPRTLDGGSEVKADMISTVNADGSAGSSNEASQKTADYTATTRRYIPVQSRLLTNITFLRLVTDKVTQRSKKTPQVPAPTTFETRPGEVSKLIHFETRESISTAHHYLQNTYRFDSAVGGQDTFATGSSSPAAGQAIARFSLAKLQWQPDIPLRIAEIIRKRILTALKLLADSASAARSQPLPARPSGAIALPTPRDGMFSGEELRRLMRATSSTTSPTGLKIRAVASEPKEGPSPHSGSSTSSDVDVSVPLQTHAPVTIQDAEYHALGHSEWLPGSIFLGIGNDDVANPDSSDSVSSSLPPLPSNNPLIPPMIAVSDTYRFPVFSLRHLFTNATAPNASDLEELNNLIRQESIFQHPHQTSRGEGDAGGHLVLIRPVPGPAKAVIEEVWRLWRYLGGRNMDWSFTSGTERESGAENRVNYMDNEDTEHDEERRPKPNY